MCLLRFLSLHYNTVQVLERSQIGEQPDLIYEMEKRFTHFVRNTFRQNKEKSNLRIYMITFLYEYREFISPALGVLLGVMFLALYNTKMSSHPLSRWAPTPSQVAISTRTAIIWISIVLVVLISICIGGIFEHQSTGLVGGMIVGTFVTALAYCGIALLFTRLTSPKNQA